MFFLIFIFLIKYANAQNSNNAQKVVNTFTNIMEFATKFSNAASHMKNVKDSLDPNREIGFEDVKNKTVLKQISECDPNVKGLCCLAIKYCDPNAECFSSKPGMDVSSVVQSIPFCKCKAGYKGDGYTLGTGCRNIDECFDGTHKCNHFCEDTEPGYKCSCREGYRLKSDGKTCVDIDECIEGISQCKYRCVNTQGSFKCLCPPGFNLEKDGTTCKDIDECALMKEIEEYQKNPKIQLSELGKLAKTSLNKCQSSSLCTNTVGAYECGCPYGYKIDPKSPTKCIDINECEEGIPIIINNKTISHNVCSNEYDDSPNCKKCINTIGGFQCRSHQGFKFVKLPDQIQENILNGTENLYLFNAISEHLKICKDIDECTETNGEICYNSNHRNLSELVRASEYLNEPISFENLPIDTEGSININFNNQNSPSVLKKPSTKKVFNNLHPTGYCQNTVGGYSCVCSSGFRLNNSNTCQRMPECLSCKPSHKCIPHDTINNCCKQCVYLSAEPNLA